MNSALSALAGTIIGGVMSLLASWIVNQRQLRVQWLSHDRERREEVYKEFIEQSAKCYVHALQNDVPDIPELVVLYAKLSRMRVLSSSAVVQCGDRLIQRIVATYSEPNRSLGSLELVKDDSFDVIREFSEACRAEFDSLRAATF